jgi:hypothetical protein
VLQQGWIGQRLPSKLRSRSRKRAFDCAHFIKRLPVTALHLVADVRSIERAFALRSTGILQPWMTYRGVLVASKDRFAAPALMEIKRFWFVII